MANDSDLFWARVDVGGSDDCWRWGFCIDSSGYGILRFRGSRWKAHRAAYTLTIGEIPLGLSVLHSCDLRSCCNPAHLRAGTIPENIADMMAKGRYKAVGTTHLSPLSVQRRGELREQYRTAQFWSKVDVRGPDECWEWQACRNAKGYGQVGVAPSKSEQAYRVAYRLVNGPIPPGLCVLHRCDNPPCVNPAHLFLGTRADNNADMFRKGRSRPGSARPGELHHNAKLTDAQVAAIRAAYVPGEIRPKDLAERYGVSRGHVCQIVKRQLRI